MASSNLGVALVTGSVRGLGLATARRLASDGARVHVVWRSGGDAPAHLLDEFGAERVHHADLEQPGSAARLVGAVRAVDGPLATLVHAVGPYTEGALAAGAEDAVARMWSGNVATAVALFDAARADLRSARGSAVFFGVAGLDGLRARRHCAAYAAAKSALLVLVRSWAVEEAQHGVRVNAVSPGVVPHDGAHPATLDAALVRRVPQRRVGTPEEVAAAVAWLVSDAAAHTTGADLPVSGGWML